MVSAATNLMSPKKTWCGQSSSNRLTREEKLSLEVWHNDRLKKDELIGNSSISFGEIIKFPIKKTKQSYVRIFDAFHSIDQFDHEGAALGKMGELRVIIYMEDLGPVGLVANRADEFNDVNKQTDF